MPGGPDHASPRHALDAAHVSAHARLLAQRRWGAASAGVTGVGAAGTGTSGNGAAGNAQAHAQGIAAAIAGAPIAAAGDADWLPWLALGGSVAALVGAEVERRRANREAQGNPAEAGIPIIAVVLYLVAALLAGLAIYLFLGQS